VENAGNFIHKVECVTRHYVYVTLRGLSTRCTMSWHTTWSTDLTARFCGHLDQSLVDQMSPGSVVGRPDVSGKTLKIDGLVFGIRQYAIWLRIERFQLTFMALLHNNIGLFLHTFVLLTPSCTVFTSVKSGSVVDDGPQFFHGLPQHCSLRSFNLSTFEKLLAILGSLKLRGWVLCAPSSLC